MAVATRAMIVVALPASGADASTVPGHPAARRPIIFVHGFAGSASRFETQARRFASNGYDQHLIEAHEYDSTFATESVATIFARLDQRIARPLAGTGADQVDLVAHSLGTFLSQSCLSSPARAATVAHYVNLDGATAAASPEGVPTLAIWGEGSTTRVIAGATNVYLRDQSHTQTVTSSESFVEQDRFFTGTAPRARPRSSRTRSTPHCPGGPCSSRSTRESPTPASPFVRYEFAIDRDGAATHHFYFAPFRRSEHLIRLQTSVPGQGLAALMDTSDRHSNVTITRNKEWWSDQATGNDELFVNATSVLAPPIAPRPRRTIGLFLLDRGRTR